MEPRQRQTTFGAFGKRWDEAWELEVGVGRRN
jgi:hypothetical protein